MAGGASDIREALDLVRGELTPDAVGWAQEFIDHNEPLLAFDVIVEGLLDGGVTVAQPVYDHLARTANGLDVADSTLWRRFVKPS